MTLNKMVDEKMPSDTEDSKECGKFTGNTQQETVQHASQKSVGAPAPYSGIAAVHSSTCQA